MKSLVANMITGENLMNNWLYDPNVTFQIWGKEHILTIFFIILIIFCVYFFRNRLQPYRKIIRLVVGWSLIVSRLSLDLWYVITDQWSLQSSLPLELCSIASLLCGIMLITKNYSLFEIGYFIAIGGATQAILTPDLNFGFPQYRFLQFFLDHMLLVLAPLIMIWLYRFTITKKSLTKSFITLNVIAGIVFVINLLFSANYMFLRQKPRGPSLLDFLGPYPYYIFSLEIVALIIFIILYLPFVRKPSSSHTKSSS